MDSEDSDPEFSDKVVKLLGKRKSIFGNPLFECLHCGKGFDAKWALNKHLDKCR